MHRATILEAVRSALSAARPGAAHTGVRMVAPPTLRLPIRYGAALVLSAAAVALTLLASDLLHPTAFLLPFAAVAVSAWLGGFGPAVAASLGSALLMWVFVFEPTLRLELANPDDAARAGLFLLIGLMIGGIAQSLRSAATAAAVATAEATRSSAEAREQRLQTELVLTSVSDGITVQSAEGRLIYANDAAARLIGFASAVELLSTPVGQILGRFEIFDEDGEPVPLDALPGRVALRDGVPAERVLRYRLKGTGKEHWSLVRASPALDEDGSVRFAVNVFHDLTERIRYEHQLEAANRTKSQFLAVMSHELRTPLNAIMGYQELLQQGIVGPVNPRQQEQLGRIGQSAHHLLDLIEQVLTLSRIEDGREEVRDDPVILTQLVEDVVSLVRPLAEKKDLDVDVQTNGAAGLVIRTDPMRVRQILLNLLSNAVKFTRAGGVRAEIAASDGVAAVTIRDTGPGVPPHEQERIFEPFVQGADADGRAPGTGLGLSVARQLAELMGGTVELDSTPGTGSAFTLRLPVR